MGRERKGGETIEDGRLSLRSDAVWMGHGCQYKGPLGGTLRL